MKCGKCNSDINDLAFTSLKSNTFLCKKCFKKEILEYHYIDEEVKKKLSKYLEDEEPEESKIETIKEVQEVDEKEIDTEVSMDLNEDEVQEKSYERTRRINGVLFFRDFKKLENTMRKISKYYDGEAQYLPKNAPSRITMEARYAGPEKNVWALVLYAEVFNSKDVESFFTNFIKEVCDKEPKYVGFKMPESIANMEVKRVNHVGQRRITEYV